MTTFTLTANGTAHEWAYNPHEAAIMRNRRRELLAEIAAAEAEYEVADRGEKNRLTRMLNPIRAESDEIFDTLTKHCPPEPQPEEYISWVAHEAEKAYKSLLSAREAVLNQMSDSFLTSGEYVMRKAADLVKAEFVAGIYYRIGYRQLEISGGEKFDSQNRPDDQECLAAAVDASLFNLDVWRTTLAHVKHEFTRRLMEFRMPSSSSQIANMHDGLRYESMAQWLNGWNGHEMLTGYLDRAELNIAIAEWVANNPAE